MRLGCIFFSLFHDNGVPIFWNTSNRTCIKRHGFVVLVSHVYYYIIISNQIRFSFWQLQIIRQSHLSIKDLDLTAGTTIGAILPAGASPVLPGGDVIIHPGDTLVLFAKETTIRELQNTILN